MAKLICVRPQLSDFQEMELNIVPKVVGYRDVTSTSRKKGKNVKRKPSRVRSKAHLAVRSNGIPPFTAWVETAKNYEPHYAMRDAQSEEKRLKEIIKAKENKLKEFQQGVKKRVKDLQRRKLQEQLGKSYEAVEMEQNVIHQSSFSRKLTLPTRDTCVYRDGSDLTIRGTCGSVVHDPTAADRASKLLDEHASKILQCSRHAREILSSKSAPVDMEQLNELPGGLWKGSPTRDHLQGTIRALQDTASSQSFTSDKVCNFTRHQELNINEPVITAGDFWVGQDEIKDMSFSELECHYGKKTFNKPSDGQDGVGVPVRKKQVRFKDQNQLQENRNVAAVNRPAKHNVSKQSTTMSDLIKPGQIQEERKKRTKGQMAVYRRLFMDLEREQVRENIRMKKHHHKMEQLKVEKEIERLTIEHDEMKALALGRDDESVDSEMMTTDFRSQKAKEGGEKHYERSIKVQKDKETERYIDALRAVLKERLQQKKVKLPPLCSCGPTVWDANPDTCANNCIFYQNPKSYAKALSFLLASSELT